MSYADWRRPRVSRPVGLAHALLLTWLVVAGIGPIVLLAKFAVTPTQDILRTPLAVFPHGVAWQNLGAAWNDVKVSHYFANTVIVAAGSWVSQIVVATTGGYLLSVLRPRYARVLQSAVLSTLFVPAVVLLVPLYLTILHPPVGPSLLKASGRCGCPQARARSTSWSSRGSSTRCLARCSRRHAWTAPGRSGCSGRWCCR